MLGKLPTAATRVALPFLLLALGGCNHLELMNRKGSIGAQEKDLIGLGLMLLVVIPVMVLTVVFA
jgi:cytochrome o ubiquinol oxidase subunit II